MHARAAWGSWSSRDDEWTDRVADPGEALNVEPLDFDDIVASAVEFADTLAECVGGSLRAAFSDFPYRSAFRGYGSRRWRRRRGAATG